MIFVRMDLSSNSSYSIFKAKYQEIILWDNYNDYMQQMISKTKTYYARVASSAGTG